jgi:hypothetical protein
MSCRKWVVRGLVLLVVVGCLGAGVLYQQWTNPEAVRQQVVNMLQEQFPGATVTLDGARLRLFGGVVLTELRLLRRDGGEKADLLHIPQAIVYHDKERLLGTGEFAVRRIDMRQPNVRIMRDKEGKWNLEGLTGKSAPSTPLPTMVIHDGTLTIEDCFAGPATWELHNLQLTILNDPADCLSFSGSASSETFGVVQVHGCYNRKTDASTLFVQSTGLCLNKELVQYAVSQCPSDKLAGLRMEGRVDLQVDLSYQPGLEPALKYDVRCQLHQALLDYPAKLKIPLHNLTASLRCTDGHLVLERLKAAAGAGKLECKATAELPDLESNFTAEMTVYHLPLEKDLADKLPNDVTRLYDWFKPRGTAKIQLFYDRHQGSWRRQYCTLEPDEIDVCFWKFPYLIERVRGFVDYDFVKNSSTFDMVGATGEHPVRVQGHWLGSGIDSDALIEIAADDIPLDQKLLDALAPFPKAKEVAASFHPSGRGHIRGAVRRVKGSPEYLANYQVRFVETSVLWDEFPYPLENVSGDLLIYPQYACEFKNFHGSHHGGDIWVQGRRLPGADSDTEGQLFLSMAGQNVCLDEDLHKALDAVAAQREIQAPPHAGVAKMPGLGNTWKTFAPAGRIGFRADIERLPRQQPDLDLTVDLAGCSIQPDFFPYALADVTGQFRYHKDKVELTKFTARHNDSRMSIDDGTVDLPACGGCKVELHHVRGNPLLADKALLDALPKKVRCTCESINLRDQPFAMDLGKLIVSQAADPRGAPEVYWDGLFWVRDAELRAGIDLNHVTGTVGCRGGYDGNQVTELLGNIYLNEATVFKQPLQGVRSKLFILKETPEVLHFDLNTPIFGGDVAGQGWLEFDSKMRYEVDLTASQIQLAEFGKHNLGPKQELNGIAASRLHLQGQDGLDGLEGNGSIDVPYSPVTRLLNLPFLLDLLKFLGLRWPDTTAFEEAHTVFAIHGKRASISKLELLGNAISLYGTGDVNLDGTDLALDMYSSWGRAEQMLPSMVRNIPSAISKQLLKIEVRGKIGDEGDLKFSKRPVPGLVEPLMEMRSWFVGKQ